MLTRTTLSGGISTKQTASFSTSSSAKTGGTLGSDYLSKPSGASSAVTELTNTVDSVIEKVLQTEQDAQESRLEVMQLFRSRATQLLHYFVLLLHTVVAQLWQVVSSGRGGTETTQAVLEVIYYFYVFMVFALLVKLLTLFHSNRSLFSMNSIFVFYLAAASVLWRRCDLLDECPTAAAKHFFFLNGLYQPLCIAL